MMGVAQDIEMVAFESTSAYEEWKKENWMKYILDVKFSSSFNGEQIWIQILVIFTEPIEPDLDLFD